VLFVSALIGGLIQGAPLKLIIGTFAVTVRMLVKTIVTVISIVVLAKIMSYSGMVGSIAGALAAVSGSFYPVIAPLIGAIGTFITGSDTSSNVLFGGLQKQTALQLGINQEWLVAANASGATAGKMISPQSIAIAVAAVNLPGKEGELLKGTIKYFVLFLIIVGIITYAGAKLLG
jgi:lactate permease